MERQWGLIGVPSSAGAHTPGLEKAPAALRDAGLIDELRRAGHRVDDHGDVAGFRWRPDRDHPHGQNAAEVVRVARETAAMVRRIDGLAQTPLVVGGDCSITVGVMAGLPDAALLYVDGGPDLYTPDTRHNGNLDAMGVAHLLGIPGHLPELAAVGPVVPLLTPARVVSYGDSLPDDDHERRLLSQLGMVRISAGEVHADARASAGRALARIESAAASFVVHCDVDVLAFVGAPLADVPDSGGAPIGLTLDELAISVTTFAASPRFVGFVLTEVNPDHAPEPGVLRDFVKILSTALTGK